MKTLASAPALVMLALAFGGCRDSTGPDARLTVTVTVASLEGPSITTVSDSETTIECGIYLRAVATGSGRATWLDATFAFYVGRDRSTPIDSAIIPASDIRSSWGTAEIAAGETQESGWNVRAGIPFGAAIEYRYQLESERRTRTTRVEFTCGPEVPPSVQPPAITKLTVQVPPGGLEPRDTLVLEYAATSEIGLWQTLVRLSGPCGVERPFAENLVQGVTRSVAIPIPAECRLGVPMDVTVFARDAALLEASRRSDTRPVLVDLTPPTVYPMLFPPSGGSATEQFSGDYFVGDSIYFIFIASDNHALRALVWEVWPAGFRDSVVVTGWDVAPWLKIPVRPEWTGPIQLRLYARDAAGLTGEAFESPPNAMRVYPTVQRPTASTSLEAEIRDVVFDTRRGVMYLKQWNPGGVVVFNMSTMTVTRTLLLPSYPADLDLTPGGDSLVVALPAERALGVIDLRMTPLTLELRSLTLLDTTLNQYPRAARVAANGKAFVPLAGSVSSAYTLLELDLATDGERLRTDAGNGGNVGGGALGRSHDHSTLVLNGGPSLFQRYDATQDAFGPGRSAIPYDWTPVVDGTGQHVAIGLDIYDASLEFLRRVRTPSPGGVPLSALSPDGAYLYMVYWSHGIVRSRVSDGEIVDRTPNPIRPDLIRASPDGATLVTVETRSYGPSKISIIDFR